MNEMARAYLTKHRQIVEALTRQMEQNALKPYDRLPSEKELCQQWQASRSTVRKAMDQLVERGKIFRVPGKGSFAAFPKISHGTSQILSFTEKMKAQGLTVETEVILKEIITPGEEVAAALGLAQADRALKIQRLRRIKGEPLALQTSFTPLSLIDERFLHEDFATQSLNLLLEGHGRIKLTRSDVWIEAPIISRKEQHLLGNPQVPLFLAVVGVTYDQRDNPVRFSRGVFRGDRVRLKISDSSVFELDYSLLLD